MIKNTWQKNHNRIAYLVELDSKAADNINIIQSTLINRNQQEIGQKTKCKSNLQFRGQKRPISETVNLEEQKLHLALIGY